ncbi:1,6-anhydro-N-acetylmuramyl-L-alanine amidase AmpD [Acidiferrobacter thiooxydans]|uniref:1,6-anhydro-N-acetylmuramyl-L-alanine amidase AmpD n=1 Tax=Acidiferrobacter thiooxydans TaxID=163359 RepID=A0A1C2G002_9GAMM|nr:1,6-anhydro-N-acetylmuramyl-L-alanine amidase AmpD [Acidiferrobacter thiooxydans]RCN55979.1 1,6-anhydro-N-acetylmuramyl-L-alanine amidase AmpD [Acidiferrobacter thiooxydans]UEN98750.1 1,6-anhydro-N-acetylmuramyl-L-alanine amidase AmpD [Acidiferrobacter thiooxydans]
MIGTIDAQGWLDGVRRAASPNCDARPPGMVVEVVIIHAISLPEGRYGGRDVERLFMNTLDTGAKGYADLRGLRVSAHVFIRRDGEVVQFVSFEDRAWHAGVSRCEGRERVNDFSVGIELEGTDHGPFEDAQYRSLQTVSEALMRHYPAITRERLYGHSEIAPGRKTDPGPFFDWARYRRALRSVGDGVSRGEG